MIDVLRGITITSVIAYHFHADLKGVIPPSRAFAAVASAADALDVWRLLETAGLALLATPAYRLDLFLFVSGAVLAHTARRAPIEFLKRRARDILPNYWMGSLLVTLCLVLLAILRSAVQATPLAAEMHHGTQLAGAPYVFDAVDVLRSLSIVGRFQDLRTFQVVAPSMWYVVLLLQAYLLFPWLRAVHEKAGSAVFLVVLLGGTWAGRAWVFANNPVPSFGPSPSVLYLIPFRLAPLALGMVASRFVFRLGRWPGRGVAYVGAAPALAWVIVTFWLASDVNQPGTTAGVLGPVVPLALGLPAFWWLATAARVTPGVGRLLAWAGRRSLSILVTQDVLRLVVGTLIVLTGSLEEWLWLLLPLCLAGSLVLARVWDPFVEWARNRLWPVATSPQGA